MTTQTAQQPKPVRYWKPSDPGWCDIIVPNRPDHELRVKAVDGEPNRYNVESASLRCIGCKKEFDARTVVRHKLRLGTACPKCGNAVLERTWYLVDLADLRLHGSCGCPAFIALGAELRREPPQNWILGTKRCKHLKAAAMLHQLVYTELLERERYKANPRLRRQEGAGA